MRRKGVHDAIWRDECVKNVHYILSPKPWDDIDERDPSQPGYDASHEWWRTLNKERLEEERQRGVADQF